MTSKKCSELNQREKPGQNCSDYRCSHTGTQKSLSYSKQFQDESNMKWLDWQLEQDILNHILSGYNTHDMHLLDFACGTGRIISFLEERFDKTTGIDISNDMLKKAREGCSKAVFICGDVTRGDSCSPVCYDVITTFRFFLNAQPQLRHEAFRWIQRRLQPRGILICNFHLNPKSLRGLYYRLYCKIHRCSKPNMLSINEARQLLHSMNFGIQRVYPYAYLFYRRSGIRCPRTMLLLEKSLKKLPWIAPFAKNFIIVAKKR